MRSQSHIVKRDSPILTLLCQIFMGSSSAHACFTYMMLIRIPFSFSYHITSSHIHVKEHRKKKLQTLFTFFISSNIRVPQVYKYLKNTNIQVSVDIKKSCFLNSKLEYNKKKYNLGSCFAMAQMCKQNSGIKMVPVEQSVVQSAYTPALCGHRERDNIFYSIHKMRLCDCVGLYSVLRSV